VVARDFCEGQSPQVAVRRDGASSFEVVCSAGRNDARVHLGGNAADTLQKGKASQGTNPRSAADVK